MSDLLKQVYSECFDPQDVEVFDSVTQQMKVIKVPCGKCYHCLITKVNEWVTRMQAQTMYSNYAYFVTLTYDSKNYGTKFFESLDPVKHNINEKKKYQFAPLVLRKKHLQDYFKRLRKNTGQKFQYFACGEYGRNYGRPHYHFILWSDNPISKEEMQYSWSIEHEDGTRVKIGDIDYCDLALDAINPDHSYKYVCKYLQKRDFDFDKLPTKKYHYANFIKNYRGFMWQPIQTFNDYKKSYSPFFLCSKRPAIGFEYYEKNKGRFQERDFRLLELPKGCVFPSYYFRKTKESLCPYKTISTTNWKPSSYARIPNVATMLVELQNCISFNEDFMQSCPLAEYVPVERFNWRKGTPAERFSDGRTLRDDVIIFHSKYSAKEIRLPRKYFSFYDCKNKYTYSLASDWMYNVTDSKLNLIYRLPIDVVISEIESTYNYLLYKFLIPQKAANDSKRNDKMQLIKNEFGYYENYAKAREDCINSLLANIQDKQEKYYQTKNKF